MRILITLIVWSRKYVSAACVFNVNFFAYHVTCAWYSRTSQSTSSIVHHHPRSRYPQHPGSKELPSVFTKLYTHKNRFLLCPTAIKTINRLLWKSTCSMFTPKRFFVLNMKHFANTFKIFVTKIFTKIPKMGISTRKAGQLWTSLR